MFRYGDAAWLWGLVLVPFLLVLLAWAGRARKAALERFGDPELVRRLTASVSEPARRWKAALQVVAVAMLLFALARPQFGTRVETVRSVGQDVVVALDLSRSMLAEDVSPNRLERARLAILRLMQQLDGDRIALVAFAADAFVQSPLTTDYGAAAMFLDAMEPELMPIQGTDLGAALRVSLDALEEAREARVLLLVTDGEDHEGAYEEQLARAREMGVTVHVVGLGSTDGVPIPEYDDRGRRQGFLRDEEGAIVTTRLEESTLRAVAEANGGSYVRVGAGGTAFDDLVDRIAGGEGEEIEAREITQFEEQYQIFLGIALVLLIVDLLVTDRRTAERAWRGRVA